MKSTDRVKAAKAILADLLRFTIIVDDEDEGRIEAPVFSEASLYSTLGKDDARSVRGRLKRLAEMLGIHDMDLVASGREEVEEPTENRMRLWKVRDGVEQAAAALRMLDFAVMDLDRSKEFVERVTDARCEVEQAVSSAEFSTPIRVLTRILRALGVDRKTGQVVPTWERKAQGGD